MMKLYLAVILYLYGNVFCFSQGNIFGINRPTSTSWFVKFDSNLSKFEQLINLGRMTISNAATASKSLNNENYLVTYYTYDSFGVPHYYLLIVDIVDTPKVLKNLALNGSGLGSFWQIADDGKQIVGIRESMRTGASLEVASIDQTTGLIKTIGLYPYTTLTLVMTFVKEHRLYYNLIDSNRLCGINVDTGKLDLDIPITNGYMIYGLIHDSIKDRLIALVFSQYLAENAWVLAELIVEKNSSSPKISFHRIGNSSIPMSKGYSWSTTYTVALKQRQWITKWSYTKENMDVVICFDIDSGNIIRNQTLPNSQDLKNIVYFD